MLKKEQHEYALSQAIACETISTILFPLRYSYKFPQILTQNSAPVHLHELLQHANEHIVANVIATVCPREQAQQRSTQLHRDYPTNST